jgi:hypothetical protein
VKFWDTSALVPLIVDEPATPAMIGTEARIEDFGATPEGLLTADSTQAGHRFHSKPVSDSTPSRSLIPRQAGRGWRAD